MNFHERAIPLVIVGHVDHGKSTLVGRILHECGAVAPERIEKVRGICERAGKEFEYAFLLDALEAEQTQGITIDISETRFRLGDRQYVLIDAPGHKEFLKNMITGASRATAAFLLVDMAEGLKEQTLRHLNLLRLLGVKQIVAIFNKVDLFASDDASERFIFLKSELQSAAEKAGVTISNFIPISAKFGDNVTTLSQKTPWFNGPTILDALSTFEAVPAGVDLPLFLPIQDVYKFDERRLIAGRLESGKLKVGQRIIFWPAQKSAVIKSFENGSPHPLSEAFAGDSVAVTLEEPLFVERGDVMTEIGNPPCLAIQFEAHIFWLGQTSLEIGQFFRFKIATQEIEGEVVSISESKKIESGDVGVAQIVLKTPAVVATFGEIPGMGRFVMMKENKVIGGGIITKPEALNSKEPVAVNCFIKSELGRVGALHREKVLGHKAAVIWLTGLSASGKSTIAIELEQQLWKRNVKAFRLDGDDLRQGLCRDLGFSREDRFENIRRAGEVAALFAEAGMVVITAFISPYRFERDEARKNANNNSFVEVFVDCPIDVCEVRDPKGLYKKARQGLIKDFTGISAPYEAPISPEIRIQSNKINEKDSVKTILNYLEKREIIRPKMNLAVCDKPLTL